MFWDPDCYLAPKGLLFPSLYMKRADLNTKIPHSILPTRRNIWNDLSK